MIIGDMRDRVIVQTSVQTNTSADSWGRTDTYSDACIVWANVERVSAEKRYMNLTGEYVIRYRVTLRWRDDITMLSRLKWSGNYLYINDINGDPATGTMTLMCFEKDTQP